jgi:hypothetical protein
MALSNNGFVGVDNEWKEISKRYIGVGEQWKNVKFQWFGDKGYWRLGYTDNRIDLSVPFYVRYLNVYSPETSNSIEMVGANLKDYSIISPKTGNYNELLSNASDYFDNFGSGVYINNPQVGGSVGNQQCMVINATNQYFRTHSSLNALGIFGNTGAKDYNISLHYYLPSIIQTVLLSYGNNSNGMEIFVDVNGAIIQRKWVGGSPTTIFQTPNNTAIVGWNSFCVIKISGTTNIYIKGDLTSKATGNLNITPTPLVTDLLRIGAGITNNSIIGTGFRYFYQSIILLNNTQISALTDRANPAIIIKKNNVETVIGNEWLVILNNDSLRFTVPPNHPLGNYELFLRYSSGIESYRFPFSIVDFDVQYTEFEDDFSNPNTLNQNYYVLNGQWGGANGGVVPENVFIDNGELVLRANGDRYTGDIQGVDRNGNKKFHTDLNDPQLGLPWTNRVGGVIQFKKYTGFGSYEIDCLIPNNLGVAYALWTFHYEEIYPNDTRYNSFKSEDLHEQGNLADGFYIVRNNEIDIEFPSHLTGGQLNNPSLANMKCNNWTGELQNWDFPPPNPAYWEEYDSQLVPTGLVTIADGNYHKLRFDWYADRVEFYIDGVLKQTNLQSIYPDSNTLPNIASKFVFGAWFPSSPLPNPKAYLVNPAKAWGGGVVDPDGGMKADFDSVEMRVKSFKFTPFSQVGIRYIGETYYVGSVTRKPNV